MTESADSEGRAGLSRLSPLASGPAALRAPPQDTTRRRRDSVFRRNWVRRNTAADPYGKRESYLDIPSDKVDRMRRRSSTVDMDLVAQLLEKDELEIDSHGVTELRDGWFDAVFLNAPRLDKESLLKHARSTLPAAFDKTPPLSIRHFFPKQRRQLKSVFFKVTTTNAGIRLLKAFLGFFAAYILCLVPQVRQWLGRYSYIMVISTIINHPARPFGAQLDGTVSTILGTVAGLGWGVLGLLLAYSSLAARAGFAGILVLFFSILLAGAAFLRSYFSRFFHFSISAGIAMCYTCLAEVDGQEINWAKLFSYGVPWVLGQAICLVVNVLFFPDAGSRRLAESLSECFAIMQNALNVPRPRDRHIQRLLARSFVNIGVAYRDFAIDISISRFRPSDVRNLRNLMQAVIRSLLLLKTETRLFENWDPPEGITSPVTVTISDADTLGVAAEFSGSSDTRPPGSGQQDAVLPRTVARQLAEPTREVISSMKSTLLSCNAALMDISGYRASLGPPKNVPLNIEEALAELQRANEKFDRADDELNGPGGLPFSSLTAPEVAELLVFSRYIRMAATSIYALGTHVQSMKQSSTSRRLHRPSYPVNKIVNYANTQVQHDRGGVTASLYKSTFHDIWVLIESIKSREHHPSSSRGLAPWPSATSTNTNMTTVEKTPTRMEADEDPGPKSRRRRIMYRIWRVLHRLQGFESKYAVKVCILTVSLAVPAWSQQSRGWWNQYETWWAVVTAWLMVHPRIGGNVQDLFTRAFCAVLGAAWAGAAYAAGDGNPYVMAIFSAIFMLPMLYRFTQSAHPRSGIAGCVSFTVVSLSLVTSEGRATPAFMAVTRGLAFLVGTVSAVVINWLLWPFIARHELRKALSSMLFFQSVIYRSTLSRYVYYDDEGQPTQEDIERSEMLEGRLREGFVRIRQILIMTRHELRLRAPFDPLPYSALADACEHFFGHLVSIRQAALYYNPGNIRSDDDIAARLLPYRRDAIASILSNLYILAGALKSDRKVPRYLPNAAAARKRLLGKMAEIEKEVADRQTHVDADYHDAKTPQSAGGFEKWAHIYAHALNESLTGCVAQLREMERYLKLIVGEQGYDDEFRDDEEAEDETTSDDDSDEESDEASGSRANGPNGETGRNRS
ncbi:hypothetical protein SODALDRAFT_317301 [Sodiomyces alkalinus F11]|uniref:Uncharacterized protein n=1 Tax=Sodiomyces alkalinus (strain CBS 110278 / VKM F-3762 / F11) TaxID=1314773 RepID=A0A3N2PJY8_SODAK|nr:hypothetical protein SODALDRAFT_317301 [Sodiomyces alkalinus F11]ROT34848.1 hypothetical protein SODALDRAFT_317301 [Sodiomyces alkalinus F11]